MLWIFLVLLNVLIGEVVGRGIVVCCNVWWLCVVVEIVVGKCGVVCMGGVV